MTEEKGKQGMARILSIVRCRLKDEGGGTFGSSTPPRHNQGGHPPWTPLLYHTPALLGYGMSTSTVADLYGTVLYCTSTSAVVATYNRYIQYLPVRVATYASMLCSIHLSIHVFGTRINLKNCQGFPQIS